MVTSGSVFNITPLAARRMAELQQQMEGPGWEESQKQEKQREEMQQREAEMKNTMLTQILSQEARARLNSIAIVKPDKAKKVEDMLIQMARTGQLQEKVYELGETSLEIKISEDQLKSLLEKVSEQTQKTTTVKFDRRRAALDSDSD